MPQLGLLKLRLIHPEGFSPFLKLPLPFPDPSSKLVDFYPDLLELPADVAVVRDDLRESAAGLQEGGFELFYPLGLFFSFVSFF
jgi:hypothetical protein